VVLTYQLAYRAAAKAAFPAVSTASLDALEAAVRTYFAPSDASADTELPDRLIYLLDHEYSEKSLAWTQLKNGDRLRAGALQQIADRLDCESYLALADVHENWTCDEDDYGDYYGRRRRRRHREDDEKEGGFEPELGELCDADVELRHWVSREGKRAPGVSVSPPDSEICFTKASVELKPFKSEHEGYMGNYGNTVDRWYHRAAFVMWPRERNFVIRAKVSPGWAVNEIALCLKTGALSDAQGRARSLLPFWASYARGEKDDAYFVQLLKVALALDDAELARDLLVPFEHERLGKRALVPFAKLVERYGCAWSEHVFTAWSARDRHARSRSFVLLPDLCDALLRIAKTQGQNFSVWLLTHAIDAFEQLLRREPSAIWLELEKPTEHTETLLALLLATRVVDAPSLRERIVAIVTTGKTALSLLALGALLEGARVGRSQAEVRALGLGGLYRHVVDGLERTLAAPPRAPDDWSVTFSVHCNCELCATLSAFLSDGSRTECTWPLVQHRRQHLEAVVNRHRLPVGHETLRRGSPHSLVLTKKKAIFEREAIWRDQHEKLLGRLRKQSDALAKGKER
jgi:hypothetical protein